MNSVLTEPLSPELLHRMDAYWRAANYLSVGQLYLYDNPLLKKPLELSHVKPLVVGHWGTTPGQNFIYVHLNRVIKKYDLDMFYIAGPGHGGPALVGHTYLEGTYSEIYPDISQDEAGLRKLFTQFSFPGGISRLRLPGPHTGNTTYKAVQRSAQVVSVGPMLQGLAKPVNDLSRGALVDDIVYTLALTAIQSRGG